MLDETMSQDTAFASDNSENDTFKFDEAELDTQSSQDETSEEEESADTTSASDEDQETVVEEQKVPYSRFKKKLDELTETTSKVQFLEERLQQLEQSRQEESAQYVELPQEWVQLYGDSEVARQAYQVQLRREDELAENTIRKILDTLNRSQEEESMRLVENEQIIDDNLESLQESVGRKFSPKQEEEILAIVDEFSPVGEDGKYVTLFPFDKAYEIYSLRNSQKGQSTRRARENVAGLTGNSSAGEVDAGSEPFRRGWDHWREAL